MAADPDLVEIALARIKGNPFENFSLMYFPKLLGVEFVPLGGMHDGGADAFGEDPIHERRGRVGLFYQASVEPNVKAKIRKTVKRLKEFGREASTLTYLSSQTVPLLDVVEDELSEELGVNIRIRDAIYIRSHVNDSAATLAAYEKYLVPETVFLRSLGSARVLEPSALVLDPTAFVFLRQEVDKLDGNVSLIDSVTDSLILWALEGTDPDSGLLMSRSEVLAKIADCVPSARSIVEQRIDSRIEALSAKSYRSGRQVNWHRQEDRFVLPVSTRERLGAENAADEALRLRVIRSFAERAAHGATSGDDEFCQQSAEVSLRSLQIAFEQEGLQFAHFVSREDVAVPHMGDAVRLAVQERGVAGEAAVKLADACLNIARESFYHGNEFERDYLGRLARTYTLLFTLRNEPRLVEYFEQMGADFYLYVGSDLLVQALSERYLPRENQHARNTLTMAAAGGATLVLTEPVVEEVLGNLRSSDNEFRNHIEKIEHRLTREMMREVPKILVRAYLYNRDESGGPSNWPGFVEQFCGHSSLHQLSAETQLQRYLQSTFSMEYRSRQELLSLVDERVVNAVTDRLKDSKSNIELAENDALLAATVYGHREKQHETSLVSEFGFRTWWLTNETSILRHTKVLENANGGARYMMRPDFLLNFFAFAPSASEVRNTFANVFPSALGVQLSRRMDERAFHKIMDSVQEAEEFEEGRRLAIMAECADRLKADFSRRYLAEI